MPWSSGLFSLLFHVFFSNLSCKSTMLIFILLVCCIHHFLQNQLVTWLVKLLINVMLYIAVTSTHCSEWYEKLCDKFVSYLASHEDWSNCLHLLTFSLFRIRESERQIHIMDHIRNMDIFLSVISHRTWPLQKHVS